MNIVNGRYVCSHCGEALPIPADVTNPNVVIRALGGTSNMRTLMLDGREIHSCEPQPLRLRDP
jgi:hypothetical protein